MKDRFDIKICGLSTPQTVETAIAAGATMVGFVFAEGSPRQVHPDTASALVQQVEGRARTVGLFADMPAEEIRRIRDEVGLDLVQIHGREDPAARQALIAAFPDALMARGIGSPEDLPAPNDPQPATWLFDARPPKGEARQGGHGVRFDWEILKSYFGPTPYLLAGGLTPDNVAEAITRLGPSDAFAGVDVSSGVESAPGIKDEGRITAFVANALAARAAAST